MLAFKYAGGSVIHVSSFIGLGKLVRVHDIVSKRVHGFVRKPFVFK